MTAEIIRAAISEELARVRWTLERLAGQRLSAPLDAGDRLRYEETARWELELLTAVHS